ncbi:MAG: DUF1499 domain-containing protein [Pseudomonadota bacterium]|nr:DUF1499 domain-containing protein [Pseudomonadota bacterium]
MTQINFSRAGAILLLTLGALWGCSATPVAKGVVDGGLADCPSTPNCISSNANDEDHRYPPLPYSGTPEQAISKLIQVIRDYPRTDIVKQDGPYLYATFTTAIMRFTDDVEFYIEGDRIQVRSASRVGYSDLGKNRSRMNDLRESFEPCCTTP